MGALGVLDVAGNAVTSLAPSQHYALLNYHLGSSSTSSSQQAFLVSFKQNSLIHQLKHLSSFTSKRRVASARCHEENISGQASEVVEHLASLDRRQLLMASSLGIAGLPFLDSKQALGSPVQPPELSQCTTPIDPGNGADLVNCCLPVSTIIVDFQFPTNLPMRVRRPAHLATSDYIAKYNRAYKLLRALPTDDPRQYAQQANVHCAFCDAAYTEGGTSVEYQVHNSWMFFPWHRWYLYFHERILASLINDDAFALSFWNWDSVAGSMIPPLFIDNDYLDDNNRNPDHLPPAIVNLNYSFTESGLSPRQQIRANYTTMYRQVVSNSKTPTLFFGQAYRQGGAASPGAGSIENVPHGTIHTWTGNPSNPNDEDMGALYSASRDPIFFSHHSNVDRLWEVWKSLGGRREDITDPDWLNATFLFYNENADLVRVRVRDALDTRKLAYRYESVANPWLTARPTSRSRFTSNASMRRMGSGPGASPAAAMAGEKEKVEEFKERRTKTVEGIVMVLVKRPKKVKADDYEEEILVIEGVEVPTDEKVKFDVYVNLPNADEKTGHSVSEYAGSFYNLPHLGKAHHEGKDRKARKSNFRIGIGEVLRELGIEEDESFMVTIVPSVKPRSPFKINDILLEYE